MSKLEQVCYLIKSKVLIIWLLISGLTILQLLIEIMSSAYRTCRMTLSFYNLYKPGVLATLKKAIPHYHQVLENFSNSNNNIKLVQINVNDIASGLFYVVLKQDVLRIFQHGLVQLNTPLF